MRQVFSPVGWHEVELLSKSTSPLIVCLCKLRKCMHGAGNRARKAVC